jgi:hypothetical protein
MLSFWESFLLFLPVFLVVNLVAAVPGRADLRDAARAGLRTFVVGTVVLIVVSTILFFLMGWMITRPPLW